MSRQSTTKGAFYESTLAKNLREMVSKRYGSVNNAAAALKVNQSTLNRYCNGETDATVSRLEAYLELSGYQAWQLMRPDFDPDTAPPLGDARAMRIAAIFASIESERDKLRAEAIMEQFAPTEPDRAAADTSETPRQKT